MVHGHCLYLLAIAQDIPAGSHMIAVHYDVVTVLPLRALIKIISEDALRKAHTLSMQTAVATVRTSLITVMALAQYHDSLTDTRRIHIIYDKFPKENSMNNYRKNNDYLPKSLLNNQIWVNNHYTSLCILQ